MLGNTEQTPNRTEIVAQLQSEGQVRLKNEEKPRRHEATTEVWFGKRTADEAVGGLHREREERIHTEAVGISGKKAKRRVDRNTMNVIEAKAGTKNGICLPAATLGAARMMIAPVKVKAVVAVKAVATVKSATVRVVATVKASDPVHNAVEATPARVTGKHTRRSGPAPLLTAVMEAKRGLLRARAYVRKKELEKTVTVLRCARVRVLVGIVSLVNPIPPVVTVTR